MADNNKDWRSLLTASERYDNIQHIQKTIETDPGFSTTKTAFVIENDAYQSSSSREDYDATCHLSQSQSQSQSQSPRAQKQTPAVELQPLSPCLDYGQEEDHHESGKELGQRIGSYPDCHYIASGVTAEVYRYNDRALKVITETHNLEPHNPFREAKILAELKKPCIPLLETFRDQEQRFTLVFPYVPFTLAGLLDQGSLNSVHIRTIFTDVFQALRDIHEKGIIHRDIKPQAILLESPVGPAYLSDFGTAWHPDLSVSKEPENAKILDIGTGPYRAPEVLFGDKSYSTAVDMWGAGCMLAESARRPPRPLFESRAVHEDGNQLGLILSIFKTIGSPTRKTWPEAQSFRTPPFDIYQVFDGRPWEETLTGVDEGWADIVKKMVRYDSRRMTAEQALEHPYLKLED